MIELMLLVVGIGSCCCCALFALLFLVALYIVLSKKNAADEKLGLDPLGTGFSPTRGQLPSSGEALHEEEVGIVAEEDEDEMPDRPAPRPLDPTVRGVQVRIGRGIVTGGANEEEE